MGERNSKCLPYETAVERIPKLLIISIADSPLSVVVTQCVSVAKGPE